MIDRRAWSDNPFDVDVGVDRENWSPYLLREGGLLDWDEIGLDPPRHKPKWGTLQPRLDPSGS